MKKVNLTEGKVFKVIFALAIPIMGGSLLQFAYNMVDMLWVGGLGSDAVASIGSASFLIGLGYSINALVVIGTGIKVAQAIGKNDDGSGRTIIEWDTMNEGTIELKDGVYIAKGVPFAVNEDNGKVLRDDSVGGFGRTGNCEYIAATAKFTANLIKDESGTTIGIVFTQNAA